VVVRDRRKSAADAGKGRDRAVVSAPHEPLRPATLACHLAAHATRRSRLDLAELAGEARANPLLIRLALHSDVFRRHVAETRAGLSAYLARYLAGDRPPPGQTPRQSKAYLNFARAFGLPYPEDVYGEMPLAAEPTSALPGSPQKMEVLRRRAEVMVQLFHPRDRREAADKPGPSTGPPVAGMGHRADPPESRE
jgi:hypothetical protein